MACLNPREYSRQTQNNSAHFRDRQTIGSRVPVNNNRYYNSSLVTPAQIPGDQPTEASDFDEPPLLDELEIYPNRILEKTSVVLNPFHSQSKVDDPNLFLRDTDIAGSIAFCLALAVCLFLSGNTAHVGYVYGFSVMSVVLIYCLLSLMSPKEGVFTLLSVASVLGYCLLPMDVLAFLGIFLTLKGTIGLILSAVAVIWSALSASRVFVTMSGDFEQRPLIAYPCALVYGVFALLVLF